jgi:threonine/homoserine/homoserine lactone efflux protein
LLTTFVLSALFLAMRIVWLLIYAVLVARLAPFFRSRQVRRRLEGLSGAILVALGVRIAVQDT